MNKRQSKEQVASSRRDFLRVGGASALALGALGLPLSKESTAAEVSYNRADMERMNKKLRESASERQAFYANPQAYLKRHGIHLAKEMIPSRQEVEAALRGKPGTVTGGGKVTIITIVHIVSGGGASPAQMKSAPMKEMKSAPMKKMR